MRRKWTAGTIGARRPQALRVYVRAGEGRCVETGFASWAIDTMRCVPAAGRSTATQATR